MPIDPAVIHESAARGDRLFPGAYWKPLPENATQTKRAHLSQFIMHTQASGGKASNTASWNWAARPDVKAEPHFLLAMDPATEPLGGLWQIMSTDVQADNNVAANPTAVSIETQDLGGATVDQTPWTEYQLDTLAALLAWLNLNVNNRVPMQLCPTPTGAGYAPHNRFPNSWSSSAHSCPGKARTAQIPEVARRAQQIIDWTPADRPEVIDPPTPPVTIGGLVNVIAHILPDPTSGFLGMDLWADGCPVNAKGEPVIEAVHWSGPGDRVAQGVSYQQRRDAHIAQGAVERSYPVSSCAYWTFLGDIGQLTAATGGKITADHFGFVTG